jgi:hypothetical protein
VIPVLYIVIYLYIYILLYIYSVTIKKEEFLNLLGVCSMNFQNGDF